MKEESRSKSNAQRFQRFREWYQRNRLKELVAEGELNFTELGPEELELAGLAALKNSHPEKAFHFLKRLAHERKLPRDSFHLGLAYAGLNKHQNAIDSFIEGRNDPKLRATALLNEADAWLKFNDPQHALATIELLHREFRPTLVSLSFKARAYIKGGQCDQALATLANNPELEKMSSGQVLKAAALLKKGELDAAIDIYRDLVNKNPGIAEHWYNLAAALSNSTDPEHLAEAIQAAHRCLAIKPQHRQARFTIALAHRKRGELPQAKQWLEVLVLEYPQSIAMVEKLAETLSDLGQHVAALKALHKANELPQSQKLLRMLGMVLTRQGEFAKAEQVLEQARSLDNRDQRTLAYLALSQLAQGKEKQARELTDTGLLLKRYHFDPSPDFPAVEMFNTQLGDAIKKHSRLRFNPAGLAARNGYLTGDLLADRKPAILTFHRLLQAAIENYIDEMPDDSGHPFYCHKKDAIEHGYELNIWGTWTREDGYIDKHIHEESWISGAYYVSVPEITQKTGSNEGFFEFGCVPDDVPLKRPLGSGSVRPVAGQLIIFPSYLYHRTIPHGSAEDRISIAFDLTPKNWLAGFTR